MADIQLNLEGDTSVQLFEAWKATPGGAQLMRWLYADAAQFGARYARTGQRVSMDYIYHRIRDRLKGIKLRLAREGRALPRVGGYALNNDFTAHISRHIVSRRPEWAGMFEQREVGRERLVERTVVTREVVMKQAA